MRYMAAGTYMPVEGFEIDPENGKDIVTTIDVNTQDIAENALLKMMYENDADHGTCIVMEVATGKIKAMSNLGRRPDGTYWEDYNYALRATEPGSTHQLATLLSVLSEGKITVNDKVEVGSSGTEFVGVRPVTDAEKAPKPILTVRECFAHSSNVGMSKIAWQTFASQPDRFTSYLHKFHLDRKTGIDLVGEEHSVLSPIKKNTEGLHAMITMSFGYALEVTPLQTLTLYNSIANNGRMMKPYLVSKIQSNGQVIKEFHPVVLEEKIANDDIVKAAQDCMLAVTTEGTGKPAFKNCGYRVGGKTGTAHVAGKGLNYDGGVYQASFVGYFPYDKPQYSCIVVIKTKPHPAKHFGGDVSAPVFKEISDKLYALNTEHQAPVVGKDLKKDSLQYFYAGSSGDIKKVMQTLGVDYRDSSANSDWSRMYATNYQPVLNQEIIRRQMMPDVKGMDLKDALYLLESMNVKVAARAAGK